MTAAEAVGECPSLPAEKDQGSGPVEEVKSPVAVFICLDSVTWLPGGETLMPGETYRTKKLETADRCRSNPQLKEIL